MTSREGWVGLVHGDLKAPWMCAGVRRRRRRSVARCAMGRLAFAMARKSSVLPVHRYRVNARIKAELVLYVIMAVALVMTAVSGVMVYGRTAKIPWRMEQGWASRLGMGTTKRGDEPEWVKGRQLMLCTHNRLFWLDVDTFEERTVHEGSGVYYGVFPGPNVEKHGPTVWVVSRPHNHHPASSIERLLLLPAYPRNASAAPLQEVVVPSRFAHDAVLDADANEAYIASTEDGSVLVLDADNMEVLRKEVVFSRHDHVNSLSPLKAMSNGSRVMWTMLHRMGAESELAQVDISTGTRLKVRRQRTSCLRSTPYWKHANCSRESSPNDSTRWGGNRGGAILDVQVTVLSKLRETTRSMS